LLLVACNGSTPGTPSDAGTEGVSACGAACQAGYFCCKKTLSCERVKYNCTNLQKCPPGHELAYPSPPYMDEASCEPLPLQCSCKEGEALKPGILGRYSALAAAAGTLYASAYENDFGDLVLLSAKLGALDSQAREIVDGVPQKPPSKAPSGWRGGIEEEGDDVGQDTDIVVGSAGEPIVSYRDVTNRSLKLARREGGKWTIHTVELPKGAKEIVGRYSALLLDGGKLSIAYLALNVPDAAGSFKSELRWATAASDRPGATADWTVTAIESKAMPCQNLCETGEVCVVKADGTSACQGKGAGCTPACTGDNACIASKCQPILPDAKYVDVPRANGLWPAPVLAASSPIVVFYDRTGTAGRLRAAKLAGGAWKVSTLAAPAGEDVGAFPAAAADGGSGVVHVSYQNATKLTLHYLQLTAATMAVSTPETVDDGLRGDGPHPVGADSAIIVDGAGSVRVIYQDAQKADLLQARRAGAGSWTPNTPSDPDLGRALKGGGKGYGFYNDLVLEGGAVYGSSFFYDAAATTKGGLAFFPLP
jgi:hypothetical protein